MLKFSNEREASKSSRINAKTGASLDPYSRHTRKLSSHISFFNKFNEKLSLRQPQSVFSEIWVV